MIRPIASPAPGSGPRDAGVGQEAGAGGVADRRSRLTRRPPEGRKGWAGGWRAAGGGLDDRVSVATARRYSMSWVLAATGGILPALHAINLEHEARLDVFLELATASCLVPRGRELTVARGLAAGIRLELDVAVHLLVPQLENALRVLLRLRGLPTGVLDDKGIEEEADLNRILTNSEFATALGEVLGVDAVADLRMLLVERRGANLRNRLMHGLMSPGQFESVEALYCWWSVLRLCVLSMRSPIGPEHEGTPQEGGYRNMPGSAAEALLPSLWGSLGVPRGLRLSDGRPSRRGRGLRTLRLRSRRRRHSPQHSPGRAGRQALVQLAPSRSASGSPAGRGPAPRSPPRPLLRAHVDLPLRLRGRTRRGRGRESG